MEEENYFCEESDCTKAACAFRFTAAATKTMTCGRHMCELLSKHIQVFTIEAIHYMHSPDDWTAYSQISDYAKSALNYMNTLEGKWRKVVQGVNQQLVETQKRIVTVVERSIKEIQLQVATYHESIQTSINQTRISLKKSMRDKRFQLNPEELALCDRTPPRFRLVLKDCRTEVAEMILNSYNFLTPNADFATLVEKQAEKQNYDAAQETVEFAMTLGIDTFPNYEDMKRKQTHKIRKKLMNLLPNSVNEQEILVLVETWELKASEDLKGKNHEKARKKLEKAKEILDAWKISSPKLSLNLSSVYLFLGEKIKR